MKVIINIIQLMSQIDHFSKLENIKLGFSKYAEVYDKENPETKKKLIDFIMAQADQYHKELE